MTVMIPCCWPTKSGACGCGRGHAEKSIGKAPLVRWAHLVDEPPTPAEVAAWARTWPHANRGELLEPLGAVEIDCDDLDALGEATALGLPPAPAMKTAKGRRYRYACPPELAGIRITKRGQSRAIDVLSGGYVIVEGRHRLGPRYEWIVPPAERPLAEAPAWALRWLREAPMDPVAAGIDRAPAGRDGVSWARADALPEIDLDTLVIHPRIKRVIVDGGGPTYPSRSEAVFAVALELIGAGYDDAVIAGVLLAPRFAISDKPRQQGRRWLAGELARARRRRPIGVI
jgi:hypothetical protein